jgi:hypothetical protein
MLRQPYYLSSRRLPQPRFISGASLPADDLLFVIVCFRFPGIHRDEIICCSGGS